MLSRLADQDDWRRKYYDSIRAVEQEGRQSRAQLEVLYKLVGRLCLAAQGQAPRLDEQLQRLRDAVRRMVPFEELEPLGKAIADVVLEMDAPAASRAPQSATRVEVTPGPVTSADATEVPVATPPPDPVPLEPSTRAVLSLLLEELAREPQLAAAAAAIDAELAQPMPDERKLHLIEKVAALVLQRIGELEKSRRELEQLLGQMLDRLDSLTRYIAGQGEEESGRTASTATLNVQITGEMRAIGESVESATDLGQIREQLRC